MTPTTPPTTPAPIGTPDGVWDLVVVGAGPAGASAALGALRADPGLRVLLLDREDFPRDKSCGDGIAPHVLDELASLGVHDVTDGWAPVRDLELARGGALVGRPMHRPAHVVPRAVLDARLVEHAVRAGAVLQRHRVRQVEVTEAGVVLDGTVTGRVVVGADGAHSVVRPALGLRPSPRRALAIRGYAPTPAAVRGRQVIVYGGRRQPSYAWAFDRGDGLANVGYGELLGPVGGTEAAPSRQLLLEQLDALVPGVVAAGGGWRAHHLPLSQWRCAQPDGPVLLAGDAAGLVNPMTGEGIYYAVASGIGAGRAAAAAVHAGTPTGAGAEHRAALRALLGRHLRHTSMTSRLSTLPAVVDAGIRAASADQGVFDDLVEIGLGRGLLTRRLIRGLARGLRPGPPTALQPVAP